MNNEIKKQNNENNLILFDVLKKLFKIFYPNERVYFNCVNYILNNLVLKMF